MKVPGVMNAIRHLSVSVSKAAFAGLTSAAAATEKASDISDESQADISRAIATLEQKISIAMLSKSSRVHVWRALAMFRNFNL